MKKLFVILLSMTALMAIAEVRDYRLPIPSSTASEYQRKQIERQYGMFICFGINTFHDEEWTDGSKPAISFAPDTVDCDQWVMAAKSAGMKFVLLTTKHHDGFCLWDSDCTDYDVASSANNTNVVDRLAAACAKHGIGLALYYSLWDRKENPDVDNIESDGAYNRYMLHQLNELLDITSKHCQVVEFWFDGGWVKPNHRWPISEIYGLIKARQPWCQVGVNWSIGLPGDPDKHTVLPADQREGYPIRYFPSDFRLGDPCLPADDDPKLFSHDGNMYYMPWESTVCPTDCWYYNTTDTNYKSLDELEQLYLQATKNDNILILNCPPARDGRMRQADVDLLVALWNRVVKSENK